MMTTSHKRNIMSNIRVVRNVVNQTFMVIDDINRLRTKVSYEVL